MVMKRNAHHEHGGLEPIDSYCHHMYHHHWLRKLVRDIVVITIAVCISILISGKGERWHMRDWAHRQDQKMERLVQRQEQRLHHHHAAQPAQPVGGHIR